MMERWPSQLYFVSILLFTIITFVSGNNITHEKGELFSQRKVQKRESESGDCYEGDGSSYRGNAAHSDTGYQCLQWSFSRLINANTHPRNDLRYNYCRNPDNQIKPWCWIDHVELLFGYCDMPKCPEVPTATSNSFECYTGNGASYRGRTALTEKGVRCLPWTSSFHTNDRTHPGNDLRYNYCRNPDNDIKPWCWTNYEQRQFGYCNVRKCSEVVTTSNEHHDESTCGKRPYDESPLSHPADNNRLPLRPVVQNPYPEKKIVGGTVVEYGAFPWQARIHFRPPHSQPYTSYCGATILSEFWLLSAAHCFRGIRKYWFAIIVGDHDKRIKDLAEQTFDVDDIILHEHFSHSTFDYDIALIKIKPSSDGRGIRFNAYVQAACLPDSRTPLVEGATCLVSGWGKAESNVFKDILIAGEVPIISQRQCERMHTHNRETYISPRMFCAGHIKGGGVDTCTGDSGGPLVCKLSDTYTLLGITSWGSGCALALKPGVYTSVPIFVSWIHETIRLKSSNSAERRTPRFP